MEMLRITGGRVLLRSDGEQMVDLAIEDGRIAGIGRDGRGTELDARGLLVLISGRDPIEPVNSIGNYAVAHAQAAHAAGFTTHIFSIADRSSTTETGFATLHRVASPVRPVRGITSILQRPWLGRGARSICRGRERQARRSLRCR